MLELNCRFYNDGFCNKEKPELGFMIDKHGKKVYANCKYYKNEHECAYYEYPFNMFLLDRVRHVALVKNLADNSIAFREMTICKFKDGKKWKEARIFPYLKKEILYKIMTMFDSFDTFTIASSSSLSKELMLLNQHLRKIHIFDISDIIGINKDINIINHCNMCNECAYCRSCKKYIKLDNNNGIRKCPHCGNINIHRKIFKKSLTKCPKCGSENYIKNPKVSIQYFIVNKKTSLLLSKW